MDKRENQEMSTNNQTDPTSSRRKFLRKASAGALIATIPAKSVWATGLTNSVVASGNGSDMAGGNGLVLKSHDDFYGSRSMIPSDILNQKFAAVFNVHPVTNEGGQHPEELTLGDILTKANNAYVHPGYNDFNLMMVSTYLNAYTHDTSMGVNFPVVGYGKSFANIQDFGRALGTMATGSTMSVSITTTGAYDFAQELKYLHNGEHDMISIN